MEFWNSFWSIIWWFVWCFAFVAYLMALFSILGDIFRDRELSGWLKAVWVLLLIFIPFLTVLVYLIVRGNGMAERSSTLVQAQQSDADAYIRNVAGTSPTDEITKAHKLLETGVIRPEEFEQIKARVLA